MVNNYFKEKYGDLLDIAEPRQIENHLENLKENNDLIYLIIAVINHWMSNSKEEGNAQNADNALKKLSNILTHLPGDTIEEILDQIDSHETKDKLTEFLMSDIDRLMDLYHSKKDQKDLLKICFLLNFLDHDNMLRVISMFSAEDLEVILLDDKMKRLFTRVIQHIMKYCKDFDKLLNGNGVIMALVASLKKEISQQMAGGPKIEVEKDFLELLKQNKLSLFEINAELSLKPFALMKVINNFEQLMPAVQKVIADHVAPMLENSVFGQECLRKLSHKISETTHPHLKNTFLDKFKQENHNKIPDFSIGEKENKENTGKDKSQIKLSENFISEDRLENSLTLKGTIKQADKELKTKFFEVSNQGTREISEPDFKKILAENAEIKGQNLKNSMQEKSSNKMQVSEAKTKGNFKATETPKQNIPETSRERK